jgi:hypothetical protein
VLPLAELETRGARPAAARPFDPVAAYVSERESKRRRGLDVLHHRAFDAKAGHYTFEGRREIAGCSLVLLRDDKEIVVMRVRDNQQAAWWARQRIGRAVVVDARGIARGRGR